MTLKKASPVINQYLQAIYGMSENRGIVKAAGLSKLLGSSPSTVHATLSRLKRDGLIFMDGKKRIFLTEKGAGLAIGLTRKRRLAERLVCGMLGIPLMEAADHVYMFINGMTPLVEEKLTEYLGNPDVCSHGKPIPRKSSCII